jgi:hypothetical protein
MLVSPLETLLDTSNHCNWILMGLVFWVKEKEKAGKFDSTKRHAVTSRTNILSGGTPSFVTHTPNCHAEGTTHGGATS